MPNLARSTARLVVAPFWRYSGRMPSIQIKNVPDEVHQALQRQARASGKSLQEYLLGELRDLTAREVQALAIQQAQQRARDQNLRVTPEEIVRYIHEGRGEH